MPVLTIRLIHSSQGTRQETVLATVESNEYDPEKLDFQINECLDQAVRVLNVKDFSALRAGTPELSILLSSGERNIRPALHLSLFTMQRLAEAGASFDFDPY